MINLKKEEENPNQKEMSEVFNFIYSTYIITLIACYLLLSDTSAPMLNNSALPVLLLENSTSAT